MSQPSSRASRASRPGLREKILQQAIGIVYREGVERITMRALADALGYSPATIYLYFRNKDDLIRSIALHGFSLLEQAIRPNCAIRDPFEAVREVARSYVDFGLSHPELYRLMFQDFSVTHYTEQERARASTVWRLSRDVYARGVASGAFRRADPDTLTATGWALVHGFVLLALSHRLRPRPGEGGGHLELRDALLEERLRALRP